MDFMMYCVLCGCDYYKLNKMGSKKAKLLIDKCVNNIELTQLQRLIWLLKELNKILPLEDRKFGKALLMFMKGQAIGYAFEDGIFKCLNTTLEVGSSHEDFEEITMFLKESLDINFSYIY